MLPLKSIPRQTAPDYPGVVVQVGAYRVIVGLGSQSPDQPHNRYFRLQTWMPLPQRSKASAWPGQWFPGEYSSSPTLALFKLKVAALPDLLEALSSVPDDPLEAVPAFFALHEAFQAEYRALLPE